MASSKPKAGVAQRAEPRIVGGSKSVQVRSPAPQSESQLVAAIRLSLGKRTDCVVWRNSTGVAMTKSGHTIRFGLCVGSADLICIVKPSGRLVACEVKTPTGRDTKEQLAFIAIVNQAGGHGTIVRSVLEANSAINYAIATASVGPDGAC